MIIGTRWTQTVERPCSALVARLQSQTTRSKWLPDHRGETFFQGTVDTSGFRLVPVVVPYLVPWVRVQDVTIVGTFLPSNSGTTIRASVRLNLVEVAGWLLMGPALLGLIVIVSAARDASILDLLLVMAPLVLLATAMGLFASWNSLYQSNRALRRLLLDLEA